jgi:hypothetical protein
MRAKKNYLFLFLIVFVLLEALDRKRFLIAIPGFPLSLGRLCFVVSGVYFLLINKLAIFKSKLLGGIILIYLGLFISTMMTGRDLPKIIGVILLVIGSVGNIYLWVKPEIKKLITFFFITLLLYWFFSSMSNTAFTSLTYSELDSDIINHHVPGLLISISATFVAIRFCYKNKSLNIWGYLIFLSSIVACLYIESRSNFIFSTLSLLFVSLMGRKGAFKTLFKLIPIIIAVFYLLLAVINSKESLKRRFTFDDQGYQKQTTTSRFELINIALDDFLSNPLFGKGVENTFVQYNGEYIMLHNQYLTFIMGGGIITMFGVILFLIGLVELALGIRKIILHKQLGESKWEVAVANSCILFFITLITIENGGILFYVIISLVLYSGLIIKKMNTKFKKQTL